MPSGSRRHCVGASVTDALEIKLVQLTRRAPSKGFDVTLLPGAPFGPEVVLDLRGREEAGVTVEASVTEEEGSDSPFLKVALGAVTVLCDLYTAGEICDALRFHELEESQ